MKSELVPSPELVQPRRVQPRRGLCAALEPQNRIPAPNTLNRNGPTLYKHIRLRKRKRIVIGSTPPTESPVKRVVVGRSAPVTVTSQPAQPLTVAIREKRFTNMREMFPEIHVLSIRNILVKHGWNEELSRDELLKYDPESN